MNKNEKFDVLSYMRSITPSKPKDLNDYTVTKWCDYWLNVCCNGVKTTTYRSYESIIEHHIKPVLGDVLLQELTYEDVQLFINSMKIGVGIEAPLSPKTIKNVHGVLHKALSTAKINSYIEFNPADKVILPSIPHNEIHVLSLSEIRTFMRAIRGHDKEYLYLITLFSGLREGEVIGLTWDCINFDEGYIKVYRQLIRRKNASGHGQHYEWGSLKNNKSRKIYLCPTAMQILLKLKAERKSNEFVFVNADGSHYTHCAVYNALQKIIDKYGMSHFRFHDLRHTYATMALKAGVDIKTLQYNLGHYTASFTLDVYGHCTDDMRTESSRKIEKLIINTLPTVITSP